jgi:hypothetical protein
MARRLARPDATEAGTEAEAEAEAERSRLPICPTGARLRAVKRFLLFAAAIALVALIGLGAAAAIGGTDFFMWAITPSGPFDPDTAPPEPDYSQSAHWGAHPDREDLADSVPRGVEARDRQQQAAADLFYIHPTAYFSRSAWNAAADHWLVRLVVDYGMLAGQASAFNEAARIYAPRYRVMTLGGYTSPHDMQPALDLAYSDVRRLEHWNDGRPILIASHSQGTQHARRLLDEFFREGPLRERLVAAYLVGFVVGRERHAADAPVPSCETPEQTGCVVSWMTFGEGGDVSLFPNDLTSGESPLCINPLAWQSGATRVPRDQNPGSTRLDDIELNVVPSVVGARCDGGYLFIDTPAEPGFDSTVMPGANYHAWDYSLFYMSVRENALARVRAFTAR